MIKIQKPKRKLILRAIAYYLYFIALITFIVVIAALLDNSNLYQKNVIFGGLMIGVPCATFGYLLQRYFLKNEKKELEIYENNIIFSLAQQSEGKINAVELSQYGQIPIEYATNMLNEMVTKGNAIVEANEKGYLEYIFPVYLKENN